MSEPYWLDLHDVCAIHNEILAESGGAAGVLLEGAIESTLHKAKNLYYYSGGKATIYQLAATYGYGFAKNHCFVDGNKRVALIVVYTFLVINDIELTASEVDAVSCFLDLAASTETQEESMQKLSEWLQENSAQISTQG